MRAGLYALSPNAPKAAVTADPAKFHSAASVIDAVSAAIMQFLPAALA